MSEFVPGLKLSRLFYREAVEPIIKPHFPYLKYAAARLGQGSEVMGYAYAMSRDHDKDAEHVFYRWQTIFK